ncbi:MAG: chromosome segregation protein SMC [Chloroflexota bacterium]|nr:MAG: chromosome segregation protein SMC [Chloroflexota bacterium]
MLTQLRFKNWRSLRDVTIDNLTPLTVFIGANSSGKTNIIDGLRFLQDAVEFEPLRAMQSRGGTERIQNLKARPTDPIDIAFSFESLNIVQDTGEYSLGLGFDDSEFPFLNEYLESNGQPLLETKGKDWQSKAYLETPLVVTPSPVVWGEPTFLAQFGISEKYSLIYSVREYILKRWQFLNENFMPPTSLPFGSSGQLFVIDRTAQNLPIMLDFLSKTGPHLLELLIEDLHKLLENVESLKILSDDRETRFYLEETHNPKREAPTISAGTARIVAMLTAYYALDIGPRAKMPGLVVIEEPDTAMNPGLLQRFVDLLRRYVREGNRQFILTTHNPSLLNYFQPEEVRVVSRDENGDTTVQPVPSHIRDIWLTDDAEYGLGEVWTTNVFGGLPK